ncbi:MAG: tetratricopeptide repeat protein [Anaerolineales bacterium]|nr:tetratricopeptide repeat protein [Anaerolineales bacterium]
MADLRLYGLGPPRVELAGAPVDLPRRKALALLIYLAASGQPHSRDALATLFWPDLNQQRARANLRRDLAVLNTTLQGNWLQTDREMIELQHEPAPWLDVSHFRHLLAASESHDHPPESPCAHCLSLLTEAAALYSNDFLAGFTLSDSAEFDDWQFFQSESLRQELAGLLKRLVTDLSAQGNYEAAIPHARRWVALNPLHEPAQRQLIHLYDQAGQPAAGLRQFEEYVKLLEHELGLPPEEETITLYEAIKSKRLFGSFLKTEEQRDKKAADPEKVVAKLISLPPPDSNPKPDKPAHNLPLQATPFIGREKDLAEIRRLLLDESAYRLLSLVGPGGIGKTRLAVEVARRSLDPVSGPNEACFADGVYFVNLAPVSAGEPAASEWSESSQVTNLILIAIAGALEFFFQGIADLKTQVLGHLRRKEMLLVLDNFEHLVEGAELLVELLNAAPGVKLLVTSRERLNLREERIWEVGGLNYPQGDWTARASMGVETEDNLQSPIPQGHNVSNLQSYDAVALFCLQAQRTRSDFSLSESEAPFVLRLCQLVEGAPLALELAASWLRVLSCAEVVAGVEHSLDFLSSSLRNVPERHRSMRAVFEQSWRMLSEPEQAAFCRLSLFKGGFQREAALAVARVRLPILVNLVDKSLLRLAPSGRYQVHELLRQFATEKLLARANSPQTAQRQQPEGAFVTWQRYSTYYLNLVSQREGSLRGSIPQPALSELRADLDNIRQAWQWAVVAAQVEEIEGALGGLARFYDLTSLFEEGAAVLGQTANDLHDHMKPADEASKQAVQKAVVKLWVEQARLLNRRGLSEQALQVIPRAVELAHQIQDTALEALAFHQWGETLSFHGQPALSQARLEEALRLARAAGLGAIEAEALRHLGIARIYLGDAAGALKYYQESLVCFRRLGDRRGEGLALNNLAVVYRGQGQWAEAETHYEQSLQIFREIDYRWGQETVLNNLANLRYDLGHYSQAQALCQQGLHICAEIKDYWGECHLLNSLGNILREQGDFPTAQSYYQQALQLWRTIGARLYEGVTLAELALLDHLTGHNETAYDYAQQSEQIGQKVDSPDIRASALTHLGHAQAALGRLSEAAESYHQALTLRQETGQLHFAREILACLSRTSLAQGNLAQAQTYAAELLPQLETEHLYGMREPFRVYLTCYQVLQADQDPRAEDVLATAYRWLQERAAEIVDEQLRRFYLENIPAHREILQAFTHQVARPL